MNIINYDGRSNDGDETSKHSSNMKKSEQKQDIDKNESRREIQPPPDADWQGFDTIILRTKS